MWPNLLISEIRIWSHFVGPLKYNLDVQQTHLRRIYLKKYHGYLKELDCSRCISLQKIHNSKTRALVAFTNKADGLTKQASRAGRCACFKYQYFCCSRQQNYHSQDSQYAPLISLFNYMSIINPSWMLIMDLQSSWSKGIYGTKSYQQSPCSISLWDPGVMHAVIACISLWHHGLITWLLHALSAWDLKFQVCLRYTFTPTTGVSHHWFLRQ